MLTTSLLCEFLTVSAGMPNAQYHQLQAPQLHTPQLHTPQLQAPQLHVQQLQDPQRPSTGMILYSFSNSNVLRDGDTELLSEYSKSEL